MEPEIQNDYFRPQRHRLTEKPNIKFTFVRPAGADPQQDNQQGEARPNENSTADGIRAESRAA